MIAIRYTYSLPVENGNLQKNLTGENANAHMRLNAMRKPVKHGSHFDLRALQRTKTALNDQKAFIAAGGILQTDRIVIGFQHPFSASSTSLASA